MLVNHLLKISDDNVQEGYLSIPLLSPKTSNEVAAPECPEHTQKLCHSTSLPFYPSWTSTLGLSVKSVPGDSSVKLQATSYIAHN